MNKKSFRVILSSTWEDLKPERRAVETALRRLHDAEFSGMEYFGSRPETPLEVSLAEVDRSDIYVGLFGARYGSGITEAEYRRAIEHDKPCLIYLKDESLSLPAAHIEQDPEKAKKLSALKSDLRSRHTLSIFTKPNELATKVVADLHNHLLATPRQDSEHRPSSQPKYQVSISNSQGIVIGDNARTEQTFS